MKILLVITIAVFGISFFVTQNYSIKKSLNSSHDAHLIALEKADLASLNLISILFYIHDLKTLNKDSFKYQVKYKKIVNVNLQSGQIIEKNDFDLTEKKFCLDAKLLSELNLVLSSSKVCQFNNEFQQRDRMCAQVLRPAYLEILSSLDRFLLGSASDACGANLIDLCDPLQKSKLLDVVKKIELNYQTNPCSK